MNKTIRILAVALVAVGLAACKKEAPPAPPPAPTTSAPAPAPTTAPAAVTMPAATLGSAIGPDKKVTRPGESFGKNDTIYVSVDTAGSGTATLKARWTYTSGGNSVPVKEDTQAIEATGPATTEFHVSKPDGWPAGDYQVELLLNDQVAQTKRYSVK